MRQPPTLTITITEPNGQRTSFPRRARGTVRPSIGTEFPWFDPFQDNVRAVSLAVAGRVVTAITDPA